MDVMIDIETLGTGDHAAVFQIGAALFDESGVKQTFLRDVHLDDPNLGKIDVSTVLWWLKQPTIHSQLGNERPRVAMRQALQDFLAFASQGKKWWGKGCDFDHRLLRQAAERCDVHWPAKFWNMRDLRTALEEHGPLTKGNPTHNAMEDAVLQVGQLLDARKK
jgi:hypothetical protein